jgi:hypothetical protein
MDSESGTRYTRVTKGVRMFKSLVVGLALSSSLFAAEKLGVASLTTKGGTAFAMDLGGYVPNSQWQVEAKVTKVLKNGFEFEGDYFECSDSSHPDLTGKKGTFLIRLPDREVANLAVDQQIRIVFNPAIKECQEQGIAIIRDDRLILGAYLRYQEVLVGLKLGMDDTDASKRLTLAPLEAKKEKLEITKTATSYQVPVEVTSAVDKSSAVLAASDIDKKSSTVKVDGKDFGVYVQQSLLTEPAKDSAPIKCKPYVLEAVIWLK